MRILSEVIRQMTLFNLRDVTRESHMGWLDGLEHIVRTDEPLAPRCALRIGGSSEFFAEPTNLDEMTLIVQRAREEGLALRLLGGGSNLLVCDEGVKGVTISLAAPEFGKIAIEGNVVRAGCGAMLAHVIATAAREGLAGLEILTSIPGTVGGALHGNSGDRATDIGRFTQSATVLTRSGDVIKRGRDDMTFAYREGSLDELAMVEAEFALESEDREELTRRMQKIWIVKRAGYPMGGQPTGYLFKDPLGMTAAELIEQAGMKGAEVGGASLFERDPNFVVLQGDASTSHVIQLMDQVREQVTQQVGVDLETNIQIW